MPARRARARPRRMAARACRASTRAGIATTPPHGRRPARWRAARGARGDRRAPPSPGVVRPDDGSQPSRARTSAAARARTRRPGARPGERDDRRRRASRPSAAERGARCPAAAVEERREHERHADELERRRQALEHAIEHRPAVAVAEAPVAAHEAAEPLQVLAPHRLVEAERAPQPLDVLGPDVRVRRGRRRAGRPARGGAARRRATEMTSSSGTAWRAAEAADAHLATCSRSSHCVDVPEDAGVRRVALEALERRPAPRRAW